MSRKVDRRLRHYLNYSKRLFTKIIVFPWTFLPDCRLKNWGRRFLLRFQNSLPLEFALDKGDIGVQVGTPWPRTLKRLRAAVGIHGKIVIIEAEPSNFDRLLTACRTEGFDNVYILNYAAWCDDQNGVLSVSPSFHGDHKVAVDGVLIDNDLRPENSSMTEIPCKFRRLDTVLSELNIGNIDYLSVTVNGAELEVLKGASETLKRSPEVRIFSKAHSLSEGNVPISQPIRLFLHKIGFKSMLTRGEPTSANDVDWSWRDGDVYAWKSHK